MVPRSRLSWLLELPIDILSHVASYMTLNDLICLEKVNKQCLIACRKPSSGLELTHTHWFYRFLTVIPKIKDVSRFANSKKVAFSFNNQQLGYGTIHAKVDVSRISKQCLSYFKNIKYLSLGNKCLLFCFV